MVPGAFGIHGRGWKLGLALTPDVPGDRIPFSFTAGVAQLAEQRTRNAQVNGSIPFAGSIPAIPIGERDG